MREIVKLSDGRLASLQVLGQGIPAIMIPGARGIGAPYLAGDAGLFRSVLRSYLVDPPGSETSTPPENTAEPSPRDDARFAEEVRKALGLCRVVVIGHSSSASAALAYAAMYPQNTAACVAIAPSGIGGDTGDSAAGGHAERGADLRPLLSRIRRPVLVLAGERDSVCGPAQARLAARAVTGAHLVVLPNCGHLPAVQAPYAYREVILDFLRGCY